MTNTSAAASVSFVALCRIAGDHDATGTGSAMRGTGLSLTSPWTALTAPSAGTNAVRRVRTAEHNYNKQAAPPRGEPR